ncbi:galactoside O-acetyltransferase [Brevinema andersonii]|uniref:Galactoside O-acetyltransferase n=1 Tax=Brevinema andersonii TaxID=34097 RepID=A0A1I1EKS5_BREAD|nr:hypothetical protein [Brevinema andersonii]SFB87744.1 galactoside O-acetyltransferase [Brevinema andersonii]
MKIGVHTNIADTASIKNSDSEIGSYCDIMHGSLISPKLMMGDFCLIDRYCVIAGSNYTFTMEDFSGLAAGVQIWCQSNDYVNALISHNAEIVGDIYMEKYTGIGANSVVMPNNRILEGTVIGANSFVPENFRFEPWSVYAGNPIRKIKNRNKNSVLEQAEGIKTK